MPVVILTKLPIELTTYVNVTLFKKTFKCNSLTMWLSIFKTAALHWLCHVPLFCLHGIRLIATNSRSVQSHRLTVDLILYVVNATVITRAWCVWRSRLAGKICPSVDPRRRPWSIRRSRGSGRAVRGADRHETPGWIVQLRAHKLPLKSPRPEKIPAFERRVTY